MRASPHVTPLTVEISIDNRKFRKIAAAAMKRVSRKKLSDKSRKNIIIQELNQESLEICRQQRRRSSGDSQKSSASSPFESYDSSLVTICTPNALFQKYHHHNQRKSASIDIRRSSAAAIENLDFVKSTSNEEDFTPQNHPPSTSLMDAAAIEIENSNRKKDSDGSSAASHVVSSDLTSSSFNSAFLDLHRQMSTKTTTALEATTTTTATSATSSNCPNFADATKCNKRKKRSQTTTTATKHNDLSSASTVNLSFLFSTTPKTGTSLDWFATTTERFMNKNGYKPQLSKIVKLMDEAFDVLELGQTPENANYVSALDSLIRIADETWKIPKIGRDLAAGVCDHFRRAGFLDFFAKLFAQNKCGDLTTRICELLDSYMSPTNRDFLLQTLYAGDFVKAIIRYGCDEREHRRQIALSLLEPILKHGPDMCKNIADWGVLDLLLRTCKINLSPETLLSAAINMSTVALFGGWEVRRSMVNLQIPAWLFVLLNRNDPRLRFYASLTLCILASELDLEDQVDKAVNLRQALDGFLKTYRPDYVAKLDTKFRLGRGTQWLTALMPLLSSKRREIQSLVAFQFAMEASLRKGTRNLDVLDEIGAVALLRQLASSPADTSAVRFAQEVLEYVGEVLPRTLGQMVPSWTPEDVQFWVTQIGFGDVAHNFAKYRVDGDLLLRTRDENLINEIGLTSKYERMRFERELKSLKCTADYSCLDFTRLDLWLMQIDKSFCVYTYQLLCAGVDRKTLSTLNDDLLKNECGVSNGIHRMKILQAAQESQTCVQNEDFDIAAATSSQSPAINSQRQIDIFICYRRSTGSQLASLLKVHLQLRGYKVFLDVDRLYAGQIDTSLLRNIKAAKHFVVVLSAHALDRCIDDVDMKDWVHIEISTALNARRNIVPVQDKSFEWPDDHLLPVDIRPIKTFNVVHWVHEYQEACVEKLEKFLSGDNHVVPAAAEVPRTAPAVLDKNDDYAKPKNDVCAKPKDDKLVNDDYAEPKNDDYAKPKNDDNAKPKQQRQILKLKTSFELEKRQSLASNVHFASLTKRKIAKSSQKRRHSR